MDTKKYEDQIPVDEGLQGNETIEEAILVLQQEPTEEMLAHTLTVIRRRARANGQSTEFYIDRCRITPVAYVAIGYLNRYFSWCLQIYSGTVSHRSGYWSYGTRSVDRFVCS